MKFYLHKAVATKIGRKRLKIEEYSIKEYSTFKEVIEEYIKTFSIDTEYELQNISKEGTIIGRITTSKQSLVPRVTKNLLDGSYHLVFRKSNSKYYCCREYLEMEVEYGLQHERFTVMETNYKKATEEYQKYMEKFVDKRNSYYCKDSTGYIF